MRVLQLVHAEIGKASLFAVTVPSPTERAGSGISSMVNQWASCGYGKPRHSETFDPEASTVFLPLSKFAADEPTGKSAVNTGSKAKPTVAERNDAIVA